MLARGESRGKLTLSRETVRDLTPSELTFVVGGDHDHGHHHHDSSDDSHSHDSSSDD